MGYEIDSLLNLVLLPCELEDACHMRVQLHRGDHKTPDLRRWEVENGISIDEEDDYHEVPYHDYVATAVAAQKIQVRRICDKDDTSREKKSKLVQALLNNISRKILKDIETYELSLTSIAKKFHYTSTIDCADLKKFQPTR